jgi:hypothetical protein
MLRQVRAQAPLLYKLAHHSKQASTYVDSSTTAFQKKAFVIELDGVNSKLVSESIKLGQSVMSAIAKNKNVEELANFSEEVVKEEEEKKEAMSMRNALLTGAGIAAVPALAANYTLNKASDDFDSKMWAIPGVAAATVGAILAARAGNDSIPSKQLEAPAKELESAINAKEVLDTALGQATDSDTYEELSKMSSISTDHIASLITDLLL